MKARIVVYWLCQVFGWGLYSVAGAWMTVAQAGPHRGAVAGYALFFLYSIGLTHLLRREIRRREWLNLDIRPALPRFLAAVLITGSVQTILVLAFSRVLSRQFMWGRAAALSLWLGIEVITGIWVILYVSVELAHRYREAHINALRLQLSLREAELRALEAQINPHFLFNSLNTIRGMIGENREQAQEMVTRLADMLRYSLQRDLNHTVPLGREVKAVADYLALESARFEDRLRVRFVVDAAAAEIQVPAMLLQTLVENALKHGIAHLPAGGEVVIRATLARDTLELAVENTGKLAEPRSETTQTGLRNIRERLRILYGDRASLSLASRDGERVAATVLIPRSA